MKQACIFFLGIAVFPLFLFFLLEECAGIFNKFSHLGCYQSFGETVGLFFPSCLLLSENREETLMNKDFLTFTTVATPLPVCEVELGLSIEGGQPAALPTAFASLQSGFRLCAASE